MDFWKLAKDKYGNKESKLNNALSKDFKYMLSNMRKICKTNEYDARIIGLGYLFEYIRKTLIKLLSFFVEPQIRTEIQKYDVYDRKWNELIFNQLSKLSVPDFIYWYFISVPYFFRDELDEYRQCYIENLKMLYDNWNSDIFFNENQFLFMTQSSYIVYPIAYHSRNNKEILTELCKLNRKICPQLNYNTNTHTNWNIGDKIKICFITDSFCNDTSVLRDRMGIILNLDNTKFDVYYATTSEGDKIKTNIAKTFYNRMKSKYIKLDPKSLNNSRNILEKYNFHIIVYPDLGMKIFQTYLAYSRIAPIQINTWGHSETSGIDTIDYYISSNYYETDEGQEHYSENLIKMNSLSTYYFEPSKLFLGDDYKFKTREEMGFRNTDIIYFCIQSFFKFNDEFEKMIGEIINYNPNSKILLSNNIKFSRSHLFRFYQNIGLDNKDRVIIYPTLEKKVFLNLMKISDVSLDPYPFGGCNSTLEAFEFDIPVVSYPTEFINGRFTYGFYKKMDIDDCIVNSTDDYIKLAIKLGDDKEYNNSIRVKINENKDKLFEDRESINEWNKVLEELIIKKFNI